MKQVGNTILAKGVNHILAKRDNSAWPKGSKLSGFSTCKSAEYHTDKWDWFDEGKWSYSNGIITITDNNESESIKVKTLTDSQLIIETTDKYTENGISYEDYELTEFRKI